MRRLLNVLWKSTRPFAAQAALVILSQLAERAAKHTGGLENNQGV